MRTIAAHWWLYGAGLALMIAAPYQRHGWPLLRALGAGLACTVVGALLERRSA